MDISNNNAKQLCLNSTNSIARPGKSLASKGGKAKYIKCFCPASKKMTCITRYYWEFLLKNPSVP